MQTVSIRELSSELINKAIAQSQLFGITNMGTLVGVLLPLNQEFIQRMTDRDSGQIRDNMRRADAEIATGQAMATLSDLRRGRPSGGQGGGPVRVTIRELSGGRIEEAARTGQTLIVHSGRTALALIVPVTPSWLEQLVEGGIHRLLDGDAADLKAQPGIAEDPFPDYAVVAAPEPAAAPAIAMVTPTREVPRQTMSGREINSQRAIGIRIVADPHDGPSKLQGIATDMLANPAGGTIERELTNMDESHVYAAILTLIDDLRDEIGTDSSLMGVGLEIGGHVHDGRIIYSANAHWDAFPLADRLNAALGLPVVIENDANALAVLERRFRGTSDDNLAVILLTHLGIGCGLVLDGRIFRGTRSMGGEMGHLPIISRPASPGQPGAEGRDETALCRCGNYDCLECASTPYAIVNALRADGFEGGYQEALQVMDRPEISAKFREAGAALGKGTACVLNLLNPSTVVFYAPSGLLGLTGEFRITDPRSQSLSWPPYLAGLVESVYAHTFSTGATDCRFIVRGPAEGYSPRAAAACLINRVLPTSHMLRGAPVMVHSAGPAAFRSS